VIRTVVFEGHEIGSFAAPEVVSPVALTSMHVGEHDQAVSSRVEPRHGRAAVAGGAARAAQRNR